MCDCYFCNNNLENEIESCVECFNIDINRCYICGDFFCYECKTAFKDDYHTDEGYNQFIELIKNHHCISFPKDEYSCCNNVECKEQLREEDEYAEKLKIILSKEKLN